MKASRVLLTAGISVIVLLILAAAFLWGIAMPLRDLPEPSGSYSIGTTSYDLTDTGRTEHYALTDTPGSRRFRVQLWYPAAAQPEGNPQPWMPDGRSHIRGIVAANGFPAFIWDHTVFMQSNSYAGAAPSATPARGFPVILVSHGWSGYRGLHSDLAEELASHGYIVAAAEHTYGAAAVQFDDGERIQASARILPSRDETPDFSAYAGRLVQTFSNDNRFLLEHLQRLNQGSALQGSDTAVRLQGRLDLSRTGLIGHSTGGGAMVDLVLQNHDSIPAISALVGLDAWVEPIGKPRLQDSPYSVPSLFLRSEQWEGGINDSFLLPFIERSAKNSEVQLFQINGATHQQFTALYMYNPVMKWLGMLGEIDAFAYADFQRSLVRDFFDFRLKQAPRPRVTYPRAQRVFPQE